MQTKMPPHASLWNLGNAQWGMDEMVQPDEGSFFLYPPPDDGAPWLLVLFGAAGRREVFQYDREGDARNVVAVLTSENDARRRGLDSKVDQVVSELVSEHGDTEARILALRERRNARRAHSRKRYAFWVAVAAEIDARGDRKAMSPSMDAPNLIQ